MVISMELLQCSPPIRNSNMGVGSTFIKMSHYGAYQYIYLETTNKNNPFMGCFIMYAI
jgi:hypothetical protein